MRFSAIDIGTNTVLLLIADIDNNKKITVIMDEIRTPRLGKGLNESGMITENALRNTIDILLEYKNLISMNKVELSKVCGTAALRESKNKNYVLSTIKTITDFDVEVLGSEEESLLSFQGALSCGFFKKNESVVIDIGGGSTEIAYINFDKIINYSFPLGVVKLTEQFFKTNPPSEAEIKTMIEHINYKIDELNSENMSGKKLIGVGGTPTTLACLDMKLQNFNCEAIDTYRISFQKILYWEKLLLSLKSNEILSLSKCTEGREDIITTGVIILAEVMRKFHFNEVIVSIRGLRYGVVLREWERYKRKSSLFL